MKKHLLFLLMAFTLPLFFVACDRGGGTDPDDPNSTGTYENIIRNAVKDKDGNKYDAVRIGDQVWMASNLKTTHYADGTEIPMGTLGDISETEPYRYYPNNNQNNVDTYGYLYNWPAVMHGAESSEANPSGVQGICPDGWHVPSGTEWSELQEYLETHLEYSENGGSIAAALASANGGWYPTDDAGCPGYVGQDINRTGFNALPAGCYQVYEGESYYSWLGECAYFWTCSSYTNTYYGLKYALGAFSQELYSNRESFCNGYTVRCLRD